jgi:1,4-dihydroxy-2-naphthoate octaprenyltransferase
MKTKTAIMNKISQKTMIVILVSIFLWLVGSAFLFRENNGKIIIIITAVVIIAGIKYQINKDVQANSKT